MCKIVFVRIANDLGNARQGSDLSRGALCVAARNYYFASGIFAPDAANARPGILFSRGSDGAGVQHYELCIFAGSAVETLVQELPLNCCAIGLSCAAPEIFYVKAGHRTILAYVHLSMYDFGRGTCRPKRLLSRPRY